MVLFTLPLENGIDLYDIMIYIIYHKNLHSACGNAILLTHYMRRQKTAWIIPKRANVYRQSAKVRQRKKKCHPSFEACSQCSGCQSVKVLFCLVDSAVSLGSAPSLFVCWSHCTGVHSLRTLWSISSTVFVFVYLSADHTALVWVLQCIPWKLFEVHFALYLYLYSCLLLTLLCTI